MGAGKEKLPTPGRERVTVIDGGPVKAQAVKGKTRTVNLEPAAKAPRDSEATHRNT